jgi:hypothetical protein
LTPFNTVRSPNPFFMFFTSIMVYEFMLRIKIR